MGGRDLAEKRPWGDASTGPGQEKYLYSLKRQNGTRSPNCGEASDTPPPPVNLCWQVGPTVPLSLTRLSPHRLPVRRSAATSPNLHRRLGFHLPGGQRTGPGQASIAHRARDSARPWDGGRPGGSAALARARAPARRVNRRPQLQHRRSRTGQPWQWAHRPRRPSPALA